MNYETVIQLLKKIKIVFPEDYKKIIKSLELDNDEQEREKV